MNILRYEILEKYGGFYVDADMLCLKPMPEEITSNRFVSVYEDEFGSPGLINNCFLGAPAGSPIMRALIDELHTKTAEEVSQIPSWKITGPVAVTEVLQPVLGQPDVQIFPSRYFVPIHFSRERPTAAPLFDAFAVHLFGSTVNAAADLEYFRQSFLKGNARPVNKQKRKRLQELTVIVQSSFVPSHPSTEMIEQSLTSLSRLGSGFQILTVFDGFQGSEEDRKKYRKYKNRVRQYLPGEFCELSDWKNSGGTLEPALQMVQTPFLLYWEHDWELTTDIPTEEILAAIDELDDVRFIRLNKRRNVTQDSDRELHHRPGMSPVPLIMTPSWSANPHFSTTTIYRNFVIPKCQENEPLEIPLFNEAQGDYRRMGLAAQYAKWGSCIYGQLGDSPVVKHLDGKQFFNSELRKDIEGNVFPQCDCPIASTCGCEALHSFERAYRVLLETVNPEKVVEWGPGLSTQLALAANANVSSFEFSEQWLPQFADPKLQINLVPVESSRWLKIDGDADVYFIDSRRRADCLDAVFHSAKPTAVVCLHDAQRRRYHAALSQFPFVWFPEPGFAIASRSSKKLQKIQNAAAR